MRRPRSPVWATSTVVTAALIIGAAALAPEATAEEKFGRLYVFGDSYADLTLSDKPATNPLAPAGVGLSLWRVYPVPLAANLGINAAQIVDVAVGGATASPTAGAPSALITPPPIAPGNLPQQVDGFLATNPSFSFSPRDLVTINIGGNDIRAILQNTAALDPAKNGAAGYPAQLLNPLNAKAFADATTGYAVGQIDRLVDVGAQSFVLGTFSTISALPEIQKSLEALKAVNPALAKLAADSADAYAKAYFEGLQAALVPYAQAGNRFFLFDLAQLGDAVNKDPGKYGFSGGFICPPNGLPGLAAGICGATPSNPTNNNPLQSQYYFGPDGLHLTNGGFDLVARYMANIVMAPDTIAVQPVVVSTVATGFTQTVLGRIDATREVRTDAGPGATGKPHAPDAAPAGRFTTYALGTFLGGSRSESGDLVGYDYDSTSGTAGLEYALGRNLVLGLAVNSTTTSAGLRNGADVDLDAIQGAAYLSYAVKQMFADIVVSYGAHDVDLTRPGILDPVRSGTDASTFAVAARGGYLFDLGGLRAGPIAGLTYVHTRVDGYTEKGDGLLTFNVSEQTLDSLTGNVGIRVLAPFRTAGGRLVLPHLNILLEHQFGDDTRTLTVDQVQTTLFLPILTSFPNFESRTYGRIEGGITFELGPDVGATISAGSTFGRGDGQDFRAGAGLSYRF